MGKLKTCVLNCTKDDLIKAIKSRSDKHNDKLVDFLNVYKLDGLKDATVEQLQEYISVCLCPKERGKL